MANAHAVVNINYVVNNHLGAPVLLVDENQHVVWQAEYDEFGKATILVEEVEFNVRFPGQYYDKETGLTYNYYRDYNQDLGRYVQSDPIGILKRFDDPAMKVAMEFGVPLNPGGREFGGFNHVYGYVGGGPTNFTDYYGLFRMYGNWGGANWSGGASGSQIPNNPQHPIDSIDACYMQHDYCYAAVESMSHNIQQCNPSIRDCDVQLAKCTMYVSKPNNLWGDVFGPLSMIWAIFKGEI